MTNALYFLAGLLVASLSLGLWTWRLHAEIAHTQGQRDYYRDTVRHFLRTDINEITAESVDLRAEVEAIREQVENPLGGVGGRDPETRTRTRD